MKHAFLLLVFLFGISAFSYAQPPLLWYQTYNGPPDNADKAVSLAVDATGNSYVTGAAYAPNGTLDMVTIKYDPNGNQLWLRSFNGSANQNDQAVKLVLDNSGNVYVTGYTENLNSQHDITTIKYNTNGVLQWAVYYDGSAGGVDEAASLCIDASGNVYVTGVEGTSNNYTTDYITLKYNSAGLLQWGHTFNGPGNFNDLATDISLDAAGNVYVLGTSDTVYNAQPNADIALLKYNNAGVLQWRKVYDSPVHGFEYAKNVTIDRHSNVIATGYGFVSGNGNDYYTMKWDSAGNFRWFHNYNYATNTFEQPNALVTDSSDNVIITGQGIAPSSGATNDYLTVKYDSAGAFQWAARYNNIFHGEDRAQAVALDDTMNIYVTGYSKGTGTQFDIATVKYDPAGNEMYVLRYDNAAASHDDMGAAVVWRNGDVYVAGSSANLNNDDYITIRYSYALPLAIATPAPSSGTLSSYPNPSHGEVNVLLPENFSAQHLRAEILNALGQVVLTKTDLHADNNRITLNTAALPTGMFFLRFVSENGEIGTSKIIVE